MNTQNLQKMKIQGHWKEVVMWMVVAECQVVVVWSRQVEAGLGSEVEMWKAARVVVWS